MNSKPLLARYTDPETGVVTPQLDCQTCPKGTYESQGTCALCDPDGPRCKVCSEKTSKEFVVFSWQI